MTCAVECIRPSASLQEAAAKMKSLDVGALPVCGDADHLAGMITDRDMTVRSAAGGESPGKIKVADVMTPELLYCFEDSSVEDAALLMKQKQVRRLVVLNNDKRLVGIIALGDLDVETGNNRLAGETLEAVSEPATAQR